MKDIMWVHIEEDIASGLNLMGQYILHQLHEIGVSIQKTLNRPLVLYLLKKNMER